MRALLTALECPKGDLAGNLRRHLELLAEAEQAACDVAVFPEFSLTGYDDRAAIPADDRSVRQLAAATTKVAAVFGIAERADDESVFITQVVAAGGKMLGTYRKRHLQDEDQFTPGANANSTYAIGGRRVGVVICAEGGVDWTWDTVASAGADVALFCSAPGLHGRRTDEASWREGFEWWDGCGVGDARKQAARLGIWVAMSTQAGVTADEDFPGIAALISPDGEVVSRLPDWREGTLIVDIP